jgi:hypothetical protein
MSVTTFRGEKNVGEIADRLFLKLTSQQRDIAEAALIKVNPQLQAIENLKEGAVLQVPSVPELRTDLTQSLEKPNDELVNNIISALDTFSARFKERVVSEQTAIEQQQTLLSSQTFIKDITNAPQLQALATVTAKALDVRLSNIVTRQNSVDEAVTQMLKDLQESSI